MINPDGASGQGGLYDKLGVPDPGNTPGARINASTWTDAQGNLWMYGGTGFDSAGGEGGLNDLWEFDRSKWLWAWMGGSETIFPNPTATTYGTYRARLHKLSPVRATERRLGPTKMAISGSLGGSAPLARAMDCRMICLNTSCLEILHNLEYTRGNRPVPLGSEVRLLFRPLNRRFSPRGWGVPEFLAHGCSYDVGLHHPG